MSKRNHRKIKQKTDPTYPSFPLNESKLDPNRQDRDRERHNFERGDPLISGFGGHYGHESELENRKSLKGKEKLKSRFKKK